MPAMDALGTGHADASLFGGLVIMMGAALAAALVFRRLRLPYTIAYIVAGCVIGPHVTGLVPDPETFRFLAEFGVVFLLFSIGLEFSLPRLLALRGTVFGVGFAQVLVCTLLFGLAVYFWGVTIEPAIVIAGALSLSSTAIVTRELNSLGHLHDRHGQLAIGVLLFQDLAALVFLIMIPVLAGSERESLGMNIAFALASGAALFGILMSVGKWMLPPLYREIAASRSEEIFVISTLVIVLLAAWLTKSFGLSMALGGFVIGMMLGESRYRYQIQSDIRGFKDILLALFFVTIGMGIQVDLLVDYWPRLLLFAAVLILVKAVVIAVVVGISGNTRDTALKSGMNLAQAGEFSIAMLALGQITGVVPSDNASFIILVVTLTMAVSPLLLRNSQQLTNAVLRVTRSNSGAQEKIRYQPTAYTAGHVIVGGYGRVGRVIMDLLEENDIPCVAIDKDVRVVDEAQAQSRNVLFGDSANIDLLRSCHIDDALLAVLTIKSLEEAKNLIEQLRLMEIETPLIVRCFEKGDVEELTSLGANYVVPEMLEASLAIGAQVLEILRVDRTLIQEQLAARRKAPSQED